MKANYLLKHNIDTLLHARGQLRKDLAMWCRRSESWLSQIFKDEHRDIPTKYLDRIADFFGIATYQLLQPGISHLTERRATERRTGRDRRASQAYAAMHGAASSAARHPDELVLLAKYRKLEPEEQRRLDQAADVLLLSRDAESSTAPPGAPPKITGPVKHGPRRIPREKQGHG